MPRTTMQARLFAAGLAILTTALVLVIGWNSYAWIGRTFPGFVLLDNRLVASVGLPSWSGANVDNLHWWQVTSVDGVPVTAAEQVYQHVASLPVGHSVTYTVSRGGAAHDIEMPSERFTEGDWWGFFFPFLFCGIVSIACGLIVWVLGPRRSVSDGVLALGMMNGLFVISAVDWYGPAYLAPTAAITEVLLAGAVLHLALVFPQESRYARWWPAGYLACLPILAVKLLYYEQPEIYVASLKWNYAEVGAAALVLTGRVFAGYRSSESLLARQRARLVTVGTILGIVIPGLVLTVTVILGGRLQSNVATFLPIVFTVSVAFAIVRHDLFEIDAMVKRGTYYVVLTGVVGGLYLMVVVVFQQLLRLDIVGNSPLAPLVFTLVLLLVLNPLRSRLQRTIDRVFFGTRYDIGRVLAQAAEELAGATSREDVASLVRRCIDEVIPNQGVELLESVPLVLQDPLQSGRLLTTDDSVEQYADLATHDAVQNELAARAAELAVGIQRHGQLIGVLLVGRKRSNLFFTASDAEFLRALAQSAAIALQNAASYQALNELNASLEQRVRTGSAQLAQAEKMASLGRLVAGVAHEINNPVSFVSGSVEPLRERLEAAGTDATPEGQASLREAGELLDIMARGAERTAAIVRDLRTFSRVDQEARKPADLHEGLEVSLRLLHPRWSNRITIHRDFGALPSVECDSGQINQVFMNLLSNACDAIAERGNIWMTTRSEGGNVHVTIRDDGTGMSAEVASRVFDPFFTTKGVGAGSGLGLSISHGIVAAHGGRIWIESEPAHGTTFHVELPVHAAPAQAPGDEAEPFDRAQDRPRR